MALSAGVFFEVFFLIIICLGAFLGNLLLFFVVAKTPALQTKGNVFILNLAAADLLVAVNMPVTIVTVIAGNWTFDENFCKVSGFFTMLTFVSSCMALTMISVNRYHAIVHWTHYHEKYTRGKCAIYVTVVWAITISLSVPPLCGWTSYEFDKGQSYCFADWAQSKSYTFFMIAACLLCPVCVMSYCYVKIIRFKRDSRRRVGAASTSCDASTTGSSIPTQDPSARTERKLTRTIMTLILVFAICWSPFAIIMIVEVFTGTKVPRAFDFGSLILGYMNSFLNIFVYNATNKNIRQSYRKFLCCRSGRVDPNNSSC